MNDRLPRRIPGPGERHRYGTWDLASDRQPGSRIPAAEDAGIDDWPQMTEEEIRSLMRRQRRLSTVAAVLLFGIVFAGVIAGYLLPETMGRPVWNGFSLSFLGAGILIYPFTWIVAAVYALLSNRMDGLG